MFHIHSSYFEGFCTNFGETPLIYLSRSYENISCHHPGHGDQKNKLRNEWYFHWDEYWYSWYNIFIYNIQTIHIYVYRFPTDIVKYYRYTRWWFQIFLIFIPILGKDSHFWLMFFSKGLVQPPTSIPSRELTYPPKAAYLKMIFLFPNWDTLVPLEGNVTCNCAFPSLKKPSSHSHQTLESTMISFNGVISAATRGRQWQVPMCWEKTGSGEGEKQIQNQNGDIYIYMIIYMHIFIYL